MAKLASAVLRTAHKITAEGQQKLDDIIKANAGAIRAYNETERLRLVAREEAQN